MSDSPREHHILEPKEEITDQNPNLPNDQSQQEWQIMARAWVAAFPEAREVSSSEVESWIESNRGSLPSDLREVPNSELVERLLAIQSMLRPPPVQSQEKEAIHADIHPARFQRTDQWRPVYSWLESLDKCEVVKSKDIADWLDDNPHVKDQLCSRHSRYHLMHYIKKCHVKILKRREKKKGLLQPDNAASTILQKTAGLKPVAPHPSNSLSNLPKDSDLYIAKRNEALRKYEILVELEKHLVSLFPDQQAVGN